MPEPREIMESFITGVYRQAKLETIEYLRVEAQLADQHGFFEEESALTRVADELEKRLRERIEKGEA